MNKMSKRDVYSWRLSTKLKMELEAAAKAERASIAAILDRLVQDWLARRATSEEEKDAAAQQRRMREQLLKAAGTVSIGGPSATNAEVRKVMGEYLEAKYRASQRRAPRRSR